MHPTDTQTGELPLSDLRPERMNGFFVYAKGFNALRKGDKAARKEFLLDATAALGALLPPLDRAGPSRLPGMVTDFRAGQAAMRLADGPSRELSRPDFRHDLTAIRAQLATEAEQMRHATRPAALADALLRDGGTANPALAHYPALAQLAEVAVQMELWRQLSKDLERAAGLPSGQRGASVVALRDTFLRKSDIETRNPMITRQLLELGEQPMPEPIAALAKNLRSRVKLFEEGYGRMLTKAFRDDWVEAQRRGTDQQAAGATCQTLDLLHAKRWADYADLLRDYIQRYDITLADPKKTVPDEARAR